MSFGVFGTVEPWEYPAAHLNYTSSKVWVLRFIAKGLPLVSKDQLLVFVKASGETNNLNMDVRGVAAWKPEGDDPNEWGVDIVQSVRQWGMPVPWAAGIPYVADDAASQLRKIAEHPDVKAAFPSLQIQAFPVIWGELVSPKDAVKHWLSLSEMWLNGKGPTSAFTSPTDYHLVRGMADDGAKAKPFYAGHGTVPFDPRRDLPRIPQDEPSSAFPVWAVVALAGVAGFLAYHYTRKV